MSRTNSSVLRLIMTLSMSGRGQAVRGGWDLKRGPWRAGLKGEAPDTHHRTSGHPDAPWTPCAGQPGVPAGLQAPTHTVPLGMPPRLPHLCSQQQPPCVPTSGGGGRAAHARHLRDPPWQTARALEGWGWDPRVACRVELDPPTSVILAQISVSRSPGLLSGVLSTCGRSSDLSVELMAMRKSFAW